jgi:K+-transporting ATPase KdpF subunit
MTPLIASTTVDNVIGLVIAIGVIAYLVVVLVVPERF